MARIRLDGATFHLEDKGSGRHVLLLHGFPTSNLLWSGVLPELVASNCRAVAPDLAGYGLSDADAEADVGMARQASWIRDLIDALGLERPLLVAHDVGSAAAQIFLARWPEQIRGLVVLDGVYRDKWAMEAVASIQTWDPSEAHRLFPLLVRRMRSTGVAGRISDDLAREVLAHCEGSEGGIRLIRAARALNPGETVAITGDSGTGRVPSLVLWGAADRYLPPDEVARPLAELLGAEMRLLPGGHFLPLEAPGEVAREILVFLDRIEG
jgi:pimeloyl-ACP methyl ester carboxylesterase